MTDRTQKYDQMKALIAEHNSLISGVFGPPGVTASLLYMECLGKIAVALDELYAAPPFTNAENVVLTEAIQALAVACFVHDLGSLAGKRVPSPATLLVERRFPSGWVRGQISALTAAQGAPES